MKKEEAQRIADNFFQRYEGSTDPIEILSTEYNHRLRDQIINASLTHPTLPSDEEIVDFAERVPGLNFDEEEGYIKGATWMRSIASALIAEMEREIEELKADIDVLEARLLLKD